MDKKLAPALSVLLTFLVVVGPVQACPKHSREAQSGGPLPQTNVHVVQRGETLFSIARRYGLTVDALAHTNGLHDPRRIYVGQRLTIPGTDSRISPEETQAYVVQAGDTLAAIARRYHTTWQVLVRINGMLSPDTIHVGQVVKVPALSRPADAEEVVRYPLGDGATYIVHPGDTLFRIALRYGVSPWALATESQIANPALIYPGQVLVIPGKESGRLPDPFVSVDISPLPAAQGSTMVVAVYTTVPVALEGRLFEQGVRFAEEDGVYYGLVGVHVFTEPGLYELALKAVDGEGRTTEITADVKVEPGRFGYERIDLSGGRANLLDPDVVAADRERLARVRQTFSPERHWIGLFERPCVGHISSYFGTHRSYNGSPYTSYHSGTDFRVPTGTPVYAPASGTVVMAETLALWGNSIVIDHGWGVLTGYAHLSTMEVAVGQQVAPGNLIARVGNSGLSTGSHLHWEMWIGGTSVNALQWLEPFYPWSERAMAEAPAQPASVEGQ